MRTVALTSVAFGKGATIARIIGEVYVMKAVASTGIVEFGLGLIVHDEANGNADDPTTDFDTAWMWHKNGFLIPHDGAGDFGPVRFTVDVRGMRKMNADDNLLFMARVSGTAGSIGFGLRVGIKLP